MEIDMDPRDAAPTLTLEQALARIAELEDEARADYIYLQDVQHAHREEVYQLEREIRALCDELASVGRE